MFSICDYRGTLVCINNYAKVSLISLHTLTHYHLLLVTHQTVTGDSKSHCTKCIIITLGALLKRSYVQVYKYSFCKYI